MEDWVHGNCAFINSSTLLQRAVIAVLNHQVAVLSSVCKRGWAGVLAELAKLALVNQVGQLIHQVNDVTTDQLMTTPYSGILFSTEV